MMYICSPGRCGSAWVSTLAMALNFRTVHEWYPSTMVEPEVAADTSWIWSRESFLDNLKIDDTIILLDRPAAERTASVNKLLGTPERTWESVDTMWDLFKASLTAKRHLNTFSVDYHNLFLSRNIFWTAFKNCDTLLERDRFDEVWNFLSLMRITNLVAERACFASYNGDFAE